LHRRHYRCRGLIVPSRNPNAILSPTEFASLRRVANGLGNNIPVEHKDVLLAMGLVQFDDLGRLALTETGARRFERDASTAWRGPTAANPFDRAGND
jgi:hypothetical protein